MLVLGYDVGTSAIKATLLDAETGTVRASAWAPTVAGRSPRPSLPPVTK